MNRIASGDYHNGQYTKQNIQVNGSLAAEAQKRLDNLTKPQGSLGRLEEFARRVVAITGDKMPVLDKKVVFTFAGDHGIANEGVSAYPKEVTPQMVLNFLRGARASMCSPGTRALTSLSSISGSTMISEMCPDSSPGKWCAAPRTCTKGRP